MTVPHNKLFPSFCETLVLSCSVDFMKPKPTKKNQHSSYQRINLDYKPECIFKCQLLHRWEFNELDQVIFVISFLSGIVEIQINRILI